MEYSIDEEGSLFFSRVIIGENETYLKDFGIWIYLQGQGFYAKTQSADRLPFYPGLKLLREQVSLFIKMNEEELKILPKFFAERSPLRKGGFTIALTGKGDLM